MRPASCCVNCSWDRPAHLRVARFASDTACCSQTYGQADGLPAARHSTRREALTALVLSLRSHTLLGHPSDCETLMILLARHWHVLLRCPPAAATRPPASHHTACLWLHFACSGLPGRHRSLNLSPSTPISSVPGCAAALHTMRRAAGSRNETRKHTRTHTLGIIGRGRGGCNNSPCIAMHCMAGCGVYIGAQGMIRPRGEGKLGYEMWPLCDIASSRETNELRGEKT